MLDLITKIEFDYDLNAMTRNSDASDSFESLLSSFQFSYNTLLKIAFPLYSQLPFTGNITRLRNMEVIYSKIDLMINKRMESSKPGNDLLSKIIEITDFRKNESRNIQDLRQMILGFLGIFKLK
eukprot:NODE_925_length_3060_cov_0.339412.p4 type:complete len:124 gc:universal NODE_925_length_3060_cov_0.339412:351-722(+)